MTQPGPLPKRVSRRNHEAAAPHFSRPYRAPGLDTFLLALALAVDHTGIVRLGLLCSCLHECGHLLVWVLLTRLPPTLIICPTGFCLSLRGVVLTPKQFIILAAAGPAVNLVLAAGGIAWLLGHPASYRLCYFIAANLLLGAFNLLPIHGLDGWQINHPKPRVSCFIPKSKPRSTPALN